MSDDERKHLEGLDEQTERERWEEFHAADRDDLAAILAKHREDQSLSRFACSCGWTYPGDFRDGYRPWLNHVAQMVLESDWLRGVKADVWDEGEKTSDCVCGHNIFAHPKDDWRHCVVAKRGECDCTGFEPATNPYRADRVDAEDGGR